MALIENERSGCLKWLLAQGFSMTAVDTSNNNILHQCIMKEDSGLALTILALGDLDFSDFSKPFSNGLSMI
jgi:hypothetical protein